MKNGSAAGRVGRWMGSRRAALVAVLLALGCGGAPEEQDAPELAATQQAVTYTGDFDGDGVVDTLTTGVTGITISHPGKGNRFYGISGSYSVSYIAELDGIAGFEVVVTRSGGVTVLIDRVGGFQPYAISGSFFVAGVSDTDGLPGGEVVVQAGNGIRTLKARSFTTSFYGISGTFSVARLDADTNGAAGTEIIVKGLSGITIIHDANQSFSYYGMSASSFNITDICNDDGVAGNEVFVQLPSTRRVINDRLAGNTTTNKSTC